MAIVETISLALTGVEAKLFFMYEIFETMHGKFELNLGA